MFSIFIWIFSTALDSYSNVIWKKALNYSTLSWPLFQIFGQYFWLLTVLILLLISPFEVNILNNYLDIFFISTIVLVSTFNVIFQINILKEVKLSDLLPYENLDKIFVVILSYFLFLWTDQATSLTTLVITILTMLLVIIFTIDLKKLTFPKLFWSYVLHKLIKSLSIVAGGYLLIKYTSVTYVIIYTLIQFWFYNIISFVKKDNFRDLFKQNKTFYINRSISSATGRAWWVIWLYLIQTSWLIVATLLWFFAVVVNIISMKYVLNDIPSKKQVLLAFIVIGMIWLWIYFK